MSHLDLLKKLSPDRLVKYSPVVNKTQCRYLSDTYSRVMRDFWMNNFQARSLADALQAGAGAHLQQCHAAVKELYRVTKEAEIYLQSCCSSKWLKHVINKVGIREACEVHVQDIMWSVAGLDLALKSLRGTLDSEVIEKRTFDVYSDLLKMQTPDLLEDLDYLTERLLSKQKIFPFRVARATKHDLLCFLSTKTSALRRDLEPELPQNDLPDVLFIPPKDLSREGVVLGHGTYGVVCKRVWLGQKVAVKQFPENSPSFQEELSTLFCLRNPYIVHLIGWSSDENTSSLVMELDLAKLNHRRSAPYSVPVALDIMLQISRGMEYLHKKGVVHRDLKPSNVLAEPTTVEGFLEEGYIRVKLADFGLARVKKKSLHVSSMKKQGTGYFRAPEILMGKEADDEQARYNEKSDVYSYGITCYEIITGAPPTCLQEVRSIDELYKLIMSGMRPNFPPRYPREICELIQKCWQSDPHVRPTFEMISKMLNTLKLRFVGVETVKRSEKKAKKAGTNAEAARLVSRQSQDERLIGGTDIKLQG